MLNRNLEAPYSLTPLRRRRALGRAGLAGAGVLAAACTPRAAEAPAAGVLAAPAQLVYLSPAASGGRLDQEAALFADFNRSRSKGDVVVQAAAGPGGWDKLREKFIVSAAAGQPIAIVQNGWGGWLDLADGGSIADLTPYVKRDRLDLKLFLPATIHEYSDGARLFALPVTMSVDALAFNLDLFDQYGLKYPPVDPEDKTWTLDRFLEAAQKLSLLPEHVGFGGGIGGGNFGGMTEPTFFGQGPWDDDKKKSLLNTPVARKAMQWWLDLAVKHHVQPTKDEAAALRGTASGNIFLSGKVGMEIFSSLVDRLSFRWGLATLPYSGPPGTKNIAGRFYCHGLHMGQVKEKDAVWEVFKWLSRPENGGRFVVTAGHAVSPLVKGGSDIAQKAYLERSGVDARAYVLMAYNQEHPEGWGMWRYATANDVLNEIQRLYLDMRGGAMSVDEYADRAATLVNDRLVPRHG
jgi:ABC-type glycerol-3-phosphate transport system substrate-binding protein